MKYIAKPVIVDAFIIISVGTPDEEGIALEVEEEGNVTATPEMIARYIPVKGDYWVIQEDGYVYINPKDVFLRKYEIQ